MSKSMARIQNGVVINIEWVGDNTVEIDELKNIYDLHVNIGDTYSNSKFYRDGNRVLSFRERIRNMLTDYDTALTEIESYIPSTFSVKRNVAITLEDRKQNVLTYLTDLLAALEEGGSD